MLTIGVDAHKRVNMAVANRLKTWLTHTCISPAIMLPVSCAPDELRDTLLRRVSEVGHS